jgi:hypothetical protein
LKGEVLDISGLKITLDKQRSSTDVPEMPRALVVNKPANSAMEKL